MRKRFNEAAGRTVLAGVLLAAVAVQGASAEVNVNVNLGPPPVVVSEPPEVVLVPGSSVYFVPSVNYDLFYYNGFWWSPRGDRWYRAREYNGPWRGVSRRIVPPPLVRVPRDYRRVYVRERHIPYGQWKKERGDHGRGRHGGWQEHGGRGEGRGQGEGHGRGRD
jgi:hypothetical protein